MAIYSGCWQKEPSDFNDFLIKVSAAAQRLLTAGDGDAFTFATSGTAESTDAPSWLLQDDARHGTSWQGYVAIDPPVPERDAGQRHAVVGVVDPSSGRGTHVSFPANRRRDGSWELTKGTIEDLKLPIAPVGPRYGEWDLATFVRWTDSAVAAHGHHCQEREKRGSTVVHGLADFAGFSYLNSALTARSSHSRLGWGTWKRRPYEVAWPAGEQGVRRVLEEEAQERGEFGFVALWWTGPDRLIQVRYTDVAEGVTMGSVQRLVPQGESMRWMLKRLGLAANTWERVSAPELCP